MRKRFLFLIFSILFFTAAKASAELNYGYVSYSGGDKADVKYKEIGKETDYICSLQDFSCILAPEEKSSVQTIEGIPNGSYFLSSSNQRFVVEERLGNGMSAAIFKVENNKAIFESSVSVIGGVKKALWTDDEKKVLILTKGNDLILYDAEQKKKINEFPFGEERYSRILLSPQGNFLAYHQAAVSPDKERTFGLIDLKNAKKYETSYEVDYWDLLSEQIRLLAFSTDESRLVYLDDKDDALTLYAVDLKKLSGNKLSGKRIITKNYSVADFLFWDADTLFFIGNRENPLQWSLYAYNLKTGDLKMIAENVSYASGLMKMSGFLQFTAAEGSAMNPSFYNPKDGTIKKFSVAAKSENKPLAKPVKIGNSYGAYLEATKPSDKLLIWLHGGPYRQTSLGFHSYLSYGVYDEVLYDLAEAGANVLKLDYTGSFGYGREFAEELKLNVGKADVADVVAAYNFAKKNWGIKEVYLMGNSYGGYLAIKSLVDNPDKFSGAFSVNGVTNWKILTDRLENSIFNVQFGGKYSQKTRKYYEQASIFMNIGKLGKQKTVIVYGTEDKTIPLDQAGLLYENMIAEGKNAELVAYEGEEHILVKPETIADLAERVKDLLGL